jgi:hypothetical protein
MAGFEVSTYGRFWVSTEVKQAAEMSGLTETHIRQLIFRKAVSTKRIFTATVIPRREVAALALMGKAGR